MKKNLIVGIVLSLVFLSLVLAALVKFDVIELGHHTNDGHNHAVSGNAPGDDHDHGSKPQTCNDGHKH